MMSNAKSHVLSSDNVPSRKRVVKACDQCRRRKTRCDGNAGCSACATMGLDCSYGTRIKQARGPAYVAHLERKLKILEAEKERAWRAVPNLHPQDSGLGAERQHFESPTLDMTVATPIDTDDADDHFGNSVISDEDLHADDMAQPYHVDPRIVSASLGSMPATGYHRPHDSHGHSNTALMLQSINRDGVPRSRMLHLVSSALDQEFPFELARSDLTEPPGLPPYIELTYYIDVAYQEAFGLTPFVDRLSLDEIIRTAVQNGQVNILVLDWRPRALLYSVVALGQRFDRYASGLEGRSAFPSPSNVRGLTYLSAALQSMSMDANDQTLPSIQALMCIAIYLQSAAAPSSAASYAHVAMKAALRQGFQHLGEGLSGTNHEQAICRQTFASLQAIEASISASTGIERTFQPFNDPDTHGEQFYSSPSDYGPHVEKNNSMTTRYASLMEILSSSQSSMRQLHMSPVSVATLQSVVEHINAELDNWVASWSTHLRAGNDFLNNLRGRRLLELAYCYAVTLIFLPALHLVAFESIAVSARAKCASAARTAVEVLHRLDTFDELHEGAGLVVPALALSMTVLSEENEDPAYEVESALEVATKLLRRLSVINTGAQRCLEVLQTDVNNFW